MVLDHQADGAVWVSRDVMEAREHKIKIRKIQDLP